MSKVFLCLQESLCLAVPLWRLPTQVMFNPKDTNTFASASLDRTIKVILHAPSSRTPVGPAFILVIIKRDYSRRHVWILYTFLFCIMNECLLSPTRRSLHILNCGPGKLHMSISMPLSLKMATVPSSRAALYCETILQELKLCTKTVLFMKTSFGCLLCQSCSSPDNLPHCHIGFINYLLWGSEHHWVKHVICIHDRIDHQCWLGDALQVWSIGSPTPNFTLEGHDKGVNSVDYYNGGKGSHGRSVICTLIHSFKKVEGFKLTFSDLTSLNNHRCR